MKEKGKALLSNFRKEMKSSMRRTVCSFVNVLLN
jgi:hypothetical protein